MQGYRRIKEITDNFLKFGLYLAGEKLDGKSYHLVQYLRAINRIIEDINPVVANPYTLLTK